MASDIVERLRIGAQRTSDASRMLAEAKSERQGDGSRDDLYMWSRPEDTDEWKAADLITTLSAQVSALEAAWLIELGSSEPCAPRYWGGVNGWTSDHNKAIRYCRKVDAQSAAGSIGEAAFHDSYRICEHAWMGVGE